MMNLPFPEDEADVSGPLFLPTNRWNLLAFLTAGIVTPREGLTKYYADLLGDCPGRLPLIANRCPADVASYVSREDPVTAFPVLLELEQTFTAPDGTPTHGPFSAPEVVLDVSSLAAVHFRSTAELEEHRLRAGDFANMPDDAVPLRVSPELFQGSGSVDELTSWLGSLPKAKLSGADFRGVDRQSGAVVATLSAAPGDPAVLSMLAALVTDAPLTESSAEWLGSWWRGRQRGRAGSANDRVFRAACDVIWSSEDSAWRSSEALPMIRTGVKLTAADRSTYDAAFTRIGEVLANQRDFEPLTPRPGREVIQALLLFLLRPDPARLARWNSHEGTLHVAMTAMYFAGLMFGRRAMASDLRTRQLDRLGRRLEIAWLLNGEMPRYVVHAEGDVVRLEGPGGVVFERPRVVPTLAELLRPGLPDSAQGPALEVCREQDWAELVEATAEAIGSDVRVEPLAAKRMRISTRGFPTWNLRIDLAAFTERLRAITPEAETPAMRELRGVLASLSSDELPR